MLITVVGLLSLARLMIASLLVLLIGASSVVLVFKSISADNRRGCYVLMLLV